MKTILIPTDFSDYANNAVEYAVEIARAAGGKILLTHVITSINEDTDVDPFDDVEERLNVICKAIVEEYPGLKCSPHVTTGDPVKSILEMAEEKNADLIVMGTKGVTKLENLFFGSNTQAIIEKSVCPVLSIPFNATYTVPQRMLFATNFSNEDVKGAIELVSLAKAFGATVIITHVTIDHERSDVDESLIKIFSREVEQLTDYDQITYLLSNENTVSMGLDSVINETQANIIALSTRKRGVFEKIYNPSITRRYSLHSDIPLLAFHYNN